jgi:hypothetical protein
VRLPSWQQSGLIRDRKAQSGPRTVHLRPSQGAFFVERLMLVRKRDDDGHTTLLRADADHPGRRLWTWAVPAIEDYRTRLVQRNVEGLLLLASEKYFEDGGTPQPNDDYGYAGLSAILSTRLQRVESIRYDIQYKKIKVDSDGHAEVEAFLSGAFELQGEAGDRYRRVSDFHRFVLQRATDGGTAKWKFLSGM